MNGNRAVRSLSYTEIAAALTCHARWDFAYGGRLAGSCLRRRQIAAALSDGRAWGAAVAAWHAFQGHDGLESAYDVALAQHEAYQALHASYLADIREQQEAGLTVGPDYEVDKLDRLGGMLDHYMATADKLPNLTLLEGRFEVPLRSRSGRQRSTKYHLEGFIDGYTVLDENENEWIVEFKLRNSLTSRKQLDLDRQHLWYAWARSQTTGRPVIGVILEERLNDAPRAAERAIQSRSAARTVYRASERKTEMTTEESYLALCEELGHEPNPEKLAALRARRWQQRVPILLRPGQLEEAGEELVSAGMLIGDLDSGRRYPIRNAQRHICSGCRFSDICANPTDELYVESLFERVPPKRERLANPA